MEISNNLFARGGDGANGGYGGTVYLYYADSNGTGGVVLRGYGEIASNGGDGVARGGSLGYVYLYSGRSEAEVRNEAGVSVRGGYVTVEGSPPSSTGSITIDGMDATPADGTIP